LWNPDEGQTPLTKVKFFNQPPNSLFSLQKAMTDVACTPRGIINPQRRLSYLAKYLILPLSLKFYKQWQNVQEFFSQVKPPFFEDYSIMIVNDDNGA